MKKRGTGHSAMDPAVLGLAFPAGREDAFAGAVRLGRVARNELDEQRLAAVLGGEGAASTIKVVRRDRVVMTATDE